MGINIYYQNETLHDHVLLVIHIFIHIAKKSCDIVSFRKFPGCKPANLLQKELLQRRFIEIFKVFSDLLLFTTTPVNTCLLVRSISHINSYKK